MTMIWSVRVCQNWSCGFSSSGAPHSQCVDSHLQRWAVTQQQEQQLKVTQRKILRSILSMPRLVYEASDSEESHEHDIEELEEDEHIESAGSIALRVQERLLSNHNIYESLDHQGSPNPLPQCIVLGQLLGPVSQP